MLTVKELRDLLEKLPGDAVIKAYEGEDTGFGISGPQGEYWWISQIYRDEDGRPYTEGFEESPKERYGNE